MAKRYQFTSPMVRRRAECLRANNLACGGRSSRRGPGSCRRSGRGCLRLRSSGRVNGLRHRGVLGRRYLDDFDRVGPAERLVGASHRLEILDQIGDELHVGHRRSARGQSELEQIEIAEIGSSQPPMIVRTNL